MARVTVPSSTGRAAPVTTTVCRKLPVLGGVEGLALSGVEGSCAKDGRAKPNTAARTNAARSHTNFLKKTPPVADSQGGFYPAARRMQAWGNCVPIVGRVVRQDIPVRNGWFEIIKVFLPSISTIVRMVPVRMWSYHPRPSEPGSAQISWR
jgi:hypothetical protein